MFHKSQRSTILRGILKVILAVHFMDLYLVSWNVSVINEDNINEQVAGEANMTNPQKKSKDKCIEDIK